MSETGKVVRIDWPHSHDCSDYDIQTQLEAGGDEGPLLVLSAGGRRGPRSNGLVAVFPNVECYLARLNGDADDFPRERWVGLVRGSDRENGVAAVAALQRMADIVAPRSRVSKPRSRFAHKTAKVVPDWALSEAVIYDGPIEIENCGEGFEDVGISYPVLSTTMKV